MKGFDPDKALRPKTSKRLYVAIAIWILTGVLALVSLTYLFYSWVCNDAFCKDYESKAVPFAVGAVIAGVVAFVLSRSLGPPPQKKAIDTKAVQQKPVTDFIGRAK